MKLFIICLLAFSFNAFSQNKIGNGNVQNYQSKVVLKVFKLNWTTPAAVALDIGSKEGTVARAGTGDYTITFAKKFEREPIVQVSPIGSGTFKPEVHAISSSSVQIKSFAADGTTPLDGDFSVSVHGWESPDEF